MLQFRRIPCLIILGVILILLFWGCDDNPLAPENEPEKDYIVYMWETDHAGEHFYMGYHPATGVIDTFTAEDGPTWNMKASADGKYLFVATRDYIAKVDLQTLQTVATLPYRADYGMAVSPDNQYLAISMGPGFVIARVSDFFVIHEDTLLDFRSCSFSSDSKKIYGYGNGSYHSVVKMDLEKNYTLSSVDLSPGFTIGTILPSFDEKKYFIIWGFSTFFNIFEVYDKEFDSIIFRDFLYGGCVFLELSPDGKYVFYTEAGDNLDRHNIGYKSISDSDGDGANYFTIFDIERNRIKMKVSTVGIEDGINPEFMALGQMAMTPDGKWLVIGEALSGSSFIRFNMATMEIDKYIKGDSTESFSCYTCQVIK